jgi:hypothetical protein
MRSSLALAGLVSGFTWLDLGQEQIAVDPEVRQQIEARAISRPLESKVFERYRIAWEDRNKYVIDHFIPLELGGSNSLDNLWPELIHLDVNGKDLGAVTKHRLEDRLIDLVHSGVISLTEAQHATAEDWVKAYEKYVGPLPDFPLDVRNGMTSR